ncbi:MULTISPECIES: type IV secretion system DNA-binding domain-containing protein [Sphingomonadaceae]|uniref:type IV secretion system DNA-binding domain-containing protein n=1 Tax=Sphingomonadales TaxID=204457 RepID=UPI000C06CA0E|nr:type IV secretion system DNA-binding domain-containing protein [Sphingobium sp. IP1]PHP20750.1 hypothetical protein CG471_05910 [Sphingobium sp. IP1]
MRADYPLSFQRECEPARPLLTIATVQTASADRLRTVRNGTGDRLAILGDGDAFTALADQTRDVLIDPALGNWDFFADHPSDYARSSAIEAFLPVENVRGTAFTYAARYVLLRAITHIGNEPAETLSGVRRLIHALPASAIAEVAGHDPSCPQALRWGETVRATVMTGIAGIADRTPGIAPVSIARWLAGPSTVILFVRRDPGRPAYEISAIEVALRDHAMLSGFSTHRSDDEARSTDCRPDHARNPAHRHAPTGSARRRGDQSGAST